MDGGYDEHDLNIARELGEIKHSILDLNETMRRQNGRVTLVEEKLNKLDVFFGKVGIVVIISGAIIATAWNFFVEFMRKKIFTGE